MRPARDSDGFNLREKFVVVVNVKCTAHTCSGYPGHVEAAGVVHFEVPLGDGPLQFSLPVDRAEEVLGVDVVVNSLESRHEHEREEDRNYHEVSGVVSDDQAQAEERPVQQGVHCPYFHLQRDKCFVKEPNS